MELMNKNIQSLRSLKTLGENAEAFFTKVFEKHSNQFSCARGCSKCCYVDLSVFSIEAFFIEEWFSNLSQSKKEQLQSLWQNASEKMGENAAGEKNPACVFLVDENCSIYESRPLICRTQGAILFFENESKVDVCPLNFAESELPGREDWLNVDRLNTLLSLVQNQFAKENVKYLDQRVTLRSLREKLIEGI